MTDQISSFDRAALEAGIAVPKADPLLTGQRLLASIADRRAEAGPNGSISLPVTGRRNYQMRTLASLEADERCIHRRGSTPCQGEVLNIHLIVGSTRAGSVADCLGGKYRALLSAWQ